MSILSRAYKRRPNGLPLSIPGLQLWLDANDGSTLFQDSAGTTPATADGDPIGMWKDKSGNNYHATQTDGTAKPLRKSSIINSNNVIRFDGTNDRLVCGDILDMGTSNLSFFVVTKIANANGVVFTKSNPNLSAKRYFLVRESSYLAFYTNTDSASGYPPYPFTQVADSSSAYRMISCIYIRNTSNTLRINGSTVLSGSISGTNDYDSNYVFQIGAGNASGGGEGAGYPLNGDIAELLAYKGSNTLTSNDVSKIENYLGNKWRVF